MEDFAEGYFWTRAQIQFNINQYVPAAADRSLPYASPLLAPDHRGLPPALIITAGFDPLRDSGEKYARKLADAGVPTHLSRYEGVVHGFLSFPDDLGLSCVNRLSACDKQMHTVWSRLFQLLHRFSESCQCVLGVRIS